MTVTVTGQKDDSNYFIFLRIKLLIYFYGHVFELLNFLDAGIHNTEFIWGKNDTRYIF